MASICTKLTLEAFEKKLKTHQLTIPKLEDERKRVSQLLANADQEIQRLQRIQPKHFAIALANPAEFSGDVENYLRGSFAEWEAIPQWFVDIVEFENRNV